VRSSTLTRGGGGHRRLGPWGTAARLAVGLAMVGDVAVGHVSGSFRPWPWVLGLAVLPALVLGWHRWVTARTRSRFTATGPAAHAVNVGLFLALYLTSWYAPALDFTSDAVLVFYGASMVVAAVRGTAGCEVLAVSNWALRRDDAVGCALFAPVDRLDGRGGAGPLQRAS
jgi:hypothetical protein